MKDSSLDKLANNFLNVLIFCLIIQAKEKERKKIPQSKYYEIYKKSCINSQSLNDYYLPFRAVLKISFSLFIRYKIFTNTLKTLNQLFKRDELLINMFL